MLDLKELIAGMRDHRAALVREKHIAEATVARTGPMIAALDDAIEKLEASQQAQDATARLHSGQVPMIPVTPTVAIKRRTKVMPTLIEVVNEAPPGIYHARDITKLVREKMRLTAKNPENGIATALLRLSWKGVVVAHGDNYFEIGAQPKPESETPEVSAEVGTGAA